MSRTLNVFAILPLAAVLVLAGTAEAQFSEMEVLRRRVDELERKLARLEVGAAPSKDEIQEMVRAELEEAQGPTTFHVHWKEGLRFDSLDEQFKLKIGGRLHVDYTAIRGDDELEDCFADEFQDEVEFRRMRLSTSGTMYGNMAYKLEFDFSGCEVGITDAYLQFTDLIPLGTLTVGRMTEPFALCDAGSTKYLTFVERPLPGGFKPGYNTGVRLSDYALNQRMTWAAGLFWCDDCGDVADGHAVEEGPAVTGRVTFLPYYADKGARLAHVGASASHREPDNGEVEYEFRPETHVGPKLVSTGTLADLDSVLLTGLEAAAVLGPFYLQGEIIRSEVDPDDGSSLSLSGYYLQTSYFLTGEHKNYDTKKGNWGRVKPANNYDGEGGWGAWEVAARLSSVDLDDGDVNGGQLTDITLGLNWYLNPNMRLMWNYVHGSADYDNGGSCEDGDIDALIMRFAADW